MSRKKYYWKPGSFTKNFSWGRAQSGLRELHTILRIGFNEEVEDVPRKLFRERVKHFNKPDYIPLNFFLFNRVEGNESFVCADELVFQALTASHGENFDRTALFAFLFSHAGHWVGARKEQRYPAMWANAYIADHVSETFDWQTKVVSADDIQRFISNDSRYEAQTSRKLATNLNHLLRLGRIESFSEKRVRRWWVDSVFLALDRLIEDEKLDGIITEPSQYESILKKSDLFKLTGGTNLEKNLATKHLIHLYKSLGGRDRFSDNAVIDRTKELMPDNNATIPNSPEPRGAIHLTNPRILKSIPPMCTDLARFAGFEIINAGELDDIDEREFVTSRTGSALAALRNNGIEPKMTSDELMKTTRGK